MSDSPIFVIRQAKQMLFLFLLRHHRGTECAEPAELFPKTAQLPSRGSTTHSNVYSLSSAAELLKIDITDTTYLAVKINCLLLRYWL